MNANKQQYNENKLQVLNLLSDAIAYLKDNDGEQGEIEAIEKLRSNVENSLFSIVLVGEFSAGKSTFLNALMGKRILPSFTSETTATVNFLRHSEKAPNGEAGIVYYRDGHTVSLPDLQLTTIEKYVSTRGDSDDERIATSVDHVDLFLNSEFLADGVQLVDSPGLNGVADNHRAITEQQIEASHAAIFMFSADHPGSKTDFEYLRELLKKSKNIFFVLNKINVIRQSEGESVEQVIEVLQSTYKKQFPEDTTLPKIWPVAGNAALVARDEAYNEYQNGEKVTTEARRQELLRISRIEDFEERLRKYLYCGERTYAQLSAPVERMIAIVSQKKVQYEQELAVLESQTSSEELQQKKTDVENKIEQLKRERKSETKELRGQINLILSELKEQTGAENSRLLDRITRGIQSCEDAEELGSRVSSIQREIMNAQMQLARKLELALREKMLEVISEECEEYSDRIGIELGVASASSQFESVSIEIQQSATTVDFGYKAYETQMKSLREQIEQLELSYETAMTSSFAAKSNEIKRKELQAKLADLEERSEVLMDTFVIPEATHYTEEYDASYWRGGLFGWIGNGLFGKKKATGTRTRTDNSAQQSALQIRDQRMKKIEEKKAAAEVELEQVGAPVESSAALAWKADRLEKELERLISEQKQLQESFTAEAKEKQSRHLNTIRQEILDQVEQLIDAITDQIKQYLDQQKRKYATLCFDMINVQLNAGLQQEQTKLEKLIAAIETEGTERIERIDKNKAAVADSKALLTRCVELQSVLQETMNDHIEQEVI